jgi:hypothetical protein
LVYKLNHLQKGAQIVGKESKMMQAYSYRR